MKRNLIYLVAAFSLMGNVALLTSCRNGVDDEYLELQKPGDNDSGGDHQPNEPVDLNGEYVNGGDKDLVMTYNGAPLTGRKVTFLADENNETATITLAGNELDLSSAIGGLLDFKITPYSPVSGEKVITLTDVNVYSRDGGYYFIGEDVQPTRTFTYSGEIKDDKMTIACQNTLANDELLGTWNLAPKNTSAGKLAPLWMDWDSNVMVNLGSTPLMSTAIKGTMNTIFNTVFGFMGNMLINIDGKRPQDLILSLLKSFEPAKTGDLFVTYPWTDETGATGFSTTDTNNIRYYYADTPGLLYVEVDPNLILNLLGGLINTATTRAADPEHAKEIGRELMDLLQPALERGIPIEYTVSGNNMTFNIEGVFLRDILRKVIELMNDDYVKPFILSALQGIEGFGEWAPTIQTALSNIPPALLYKDGDGVADANGNVAKPFTGECSYVKLGFRLVKQ